MKMHSQIFAPAVLERCATAAARQVDPVRTRVPELPDFAYFTKHQSEQGVVGITNTHATAGRSHAD